MSKNLKRIDQLPSASTPLSGGEIFEISQKFNGAWKSRKVAYNDINPSAAKPIHNSTLNKQGGILGEYYHLPQLYHDGLVGDLYTLRTETLAVSANALSQANDYTDTQSQEASANALSQANDYTDTEILALSASYDQHNELKDIQGGIPSAAEYYHLSESIHDALFSASPIIGLGNKTGTRFEVDYGSNLVKGFIDDTELLELNSEGINIGGAVSGSSVYTNTIHALTGVVTISGSSGVDLRASNNKNRVIVDSGYTRILVDATNTDHDNKNFEVFRVDQDNTYMNIGNSLVGIYLQYQYESDPSIRFRTGSDIWASISPSTQQLGNNSNLNAYLRVRSTGGSIEGSALGTRVLYLDHSDIYQFGTTTNGMIFNGSVTPSASITFELNNEKILTMDRLTRFMNLQGRLWVDSYADTNQAADLRAYQEMPGKSNFSKWLNTPRTTLPEQKVALCVYRGNMYAIAGTDVQTATEYNTVYRTSDGVNWTLLTSDAFPAVGGTGSVNVVNFQDKMIAFGGHPALNGVYSSTDAITWTQISTDADRPGRRSQSVVYKGKIWAYGDEFGQNDVHYSPDGITWTKLIGAFAPETIRMSMVVYDNAIYSIGGQDKDSGAAQDGVWKSTDGINFTQVGTLPYTSSGQALLNYDGRMIVLALGADGVTNPDGWQDRIYESFDGITWTNTGYTMPTRAFFYDAGREAKVFNGRILYGWGTKTNSATTDPEIHQTMPRADIGLQVSGKLYADLIIPDTGSVGVSGGLALTGDLDLENSGQVTLSNGASGVQVSFSVSQPDTNYYPVCTLENTVETFPTFYQIMIVNKQTGSFEVILDGQLSNDNYRINWMITR